MKKIPIAIMFPKMKSCRTKRATWLCPYCRFTKRADISDTGGWKSGKNYDMPCPSCKKPMTYVGFKWRVPKKCCSQKKWNQTLKGLGIKL